MRVGAVVLAAGAGRRYGGPKVLATRDGRTFLEIALETIVASPLDSVLVVLDPASEAAPEARRLIASRFGTAIGVVDNPDAERGMLSSIRAGLRALPEPITHAALWPVDHPGIRVATVEALVARAGRHPEAIVVPSFENRRGHPGIFPRALFPALLAAPDDEGARAVLRAHPERIEHVVVDDPATVTDVDERT